jgi:hypothetical protein
MSRKLYNLHTLQLVFIGQLSHHPPGTQRYLRLMDDAMCRSSANVQHGGSSVHRNQPVLTNKCVHVSNFGITDGCAWATWAIFMNNRFGLLEIFLPTGALSFHSYSSHNTAETFFCESPCFHSWPQNSYYRMLLLSDAVSSGVTVILTLLFESHLSCHQLHCVRTCPVDVSTHCSSCIRLCPILLNIQLFALTYWSPLVKAGAVVLPPYFHVALIKCICVFYNWHIMKQLLGIRIQ